MTRPIFSDLTPAPSPLERDYIAPHQQSLMRFNLFSLHDSKEDINVRRLIRVYSVLPKFATFSNSSCDAQAKKVVAFLRGMNDKLKKEYSLGWKHIWMKNIGYNFARKSVDDWFIGRASIPLIALQKLSFFGLEKEVNELVDGCEYFSTTTRKPYLVPHFITAELAYLTGAILGDGHLNKKQDKIGFEVAEKWLAEKFAQNVKIVFDHTLPIHQRLDRGRLRYFVIFGNKSAKRIFNKIMEIPVGKKSNIITVPSLMKSSSQEIKNFFLEGVFDTDGGKRGKNRLGLTSASKRFRDGIFDLIEEQGIKVSKDEWVNKLYNKSYYGLRFSKSANPKFMQE